ncbi:hypothetical protein [Porphyrobacter sp. ULC335]|uniref:hypothetical protein n=1 Tax=Porphyrobacter sp. ULC335 TaxID=2854260 RepID=UPI002220736C|nr:hypothetical protein [Porphyrobacter sp. ULC335]UYV16723.1 hypothetical protein KVF90_05255 [Porphyrobacter sp. ULC335]
MTHAASNPPGGQARAGHGWQLILADLALILFLLTLSALPAAEAESGERLADTDAREKEAQGALMPEVAPALALFRPVAGGPSLGAWLAQQAPDPRATLTVFVTYTKGGEPAAWRRAQALADEARASGTRVRTIITAGAEADVYASLAYDERLAETGGSDRAS